MNGKQILIFAGTTEGRKLAEWFSKSFGGKPSGVKEPSDRPPQEGPREKKPEMPVGENKVIVSTATEYGKVCLGDLEGVQILTGRLNVQEMETLLKEKIIDLVVDATHPFATEVTKNIKTACQRADVPYLRCLREKMDCLTAENAGIVRVDSVEQAAKYLKTVGGNILITTGSKELWKYTEIPDYKERCFARVLSTMEAVAESERLGFEGKHLIAMQGPFSREMNEAILRHTNAGFFVTKESGKAGGFEEKLEAARALGVTLVVIGRPKEEGMSLDEVYEYVRKWIMGNWERTSENKKCLTCRQTG
ncbi:precorrin-6A reductase [Roseburia hominis]